jgi:uracil-DNA glycosylase
MKSQITSWEQFFKAEQSEQYTKELQTFLDEEYANNTIYPPRQMMFSAFKMTPLDCVKVVILGQDPYHEPSQAMGLSFSVAKGIPLPMSLINIYKEIESDLRVKMDYSCGDLSGWARQGVLLLKAFLSVRRVEPLSHRHPGYVQFFEHVLTILNELEQPIVFLLWGSFARGYRRLLDNPRHLILESVHPSPLAANRGGWFGKRHFSQTNEFLSRHHLEPIDWQNTSRT